MNGISFDSAADLIGGQLPFLKETSTKSTKGSARALAVPPGVHGPCSIDLGDCRGLMKGRTKCLTCI